MEFRECFVCGLFATQTLWCTDHGFPGSDAANSHENPQLEMLLGNIREQLKAERLNEAIRLLVDRLMAPAYISE